MVSFSQPLWLLLGLLVLPILALHMRRRRRLTVSTTYIWERVTRGSAYRATRSLPVASLLLALQLLLLTLLVLALARPHLGGRLPYHWIVVVDASGSMQATDVSPSRLAAAHAYLESSLARRIGARGVPKLVSVIAVGSQAQLMGARLTSLSDARAAVAAIRSSAAAPDWAQLREVLPGLAKVRESTGVTLLTDPADEATARSSIAAALGDVPIDTVLFAGKHPVNLGLTAVNIALEKSGKWHVTGTVKRFAGSVVDTQVTVLFEPNGSSNNVAWTKQTVKLARDGQGTFDTELDLPAPGTIEVRLPNDDLASDNSAFAVLRGSPRQVRVLEVGTGDGPLERALTSIEGVKVYRAATLPVDASNYDLVVVDGVQLDRRPGTATWWLDAPPPGVNFGTELKNPTATSWDRDHPLSSTVDWPAVGVQRAATAPHLPGALVLLASAGHPLVQARTVPSGREVLTTFALNDSNWSHLTSFPSFVYNLVRWVAPDLGAQVVPACQAGAICPLDPTHLAGAVHLSGPAGDPVVLPDPWLGSNGDESGSSATKWLAPWADALFRPPEPGIYTLGGGDTTEVVAVDAFGTGTSALQPGGALSHHGARVGPAIWKVLVAVALLVLAIEAWLAAGGPLPRRRRSTYASVRQRSVWSWRAVALALLVLALVDPPLPWPQRFHRTVLVTDAPSLYGSSGEVTLQQFQRTAARQAGNGRRLGVVELGSHPTVTADVGARWRAPTPSVSAWVGSDLGDALLTAAAMLPRTGATGRVVVASGGASTGAGLANSIRVLHARGIPVDVLPVATARTDDAAAIRVEVPADVYPMAPFTAQALIHSQSAQSASVRFMMDGQLKVERPVQLTAGGNDVQAQLTVDDSGLHKVTVEVRAARDNFAANDRCVLAVDVRPRPSVALITDEDNQARVLVGALAQEGVDAHVLSPTDAPWKVGGWLNYDAAVLMDVPSIDLHSTQQRELERWVRDDGGGLIILGGPNTFGPGGYIATPLERMSPLSSKIPRQAPQVAMLFVLDRSGSMQQSVGDVSRLGIAKKATLEALRLLNPQSLTGVVVFDTKATTVAALQPASDSSALSAALSQVQAAGGTALYPALVEALGQLQGVSSMAKHVVVMSDGLSQPADFATLLDKMRAVGITVSTVAISQDADKNFLQQIASLGKGAFHSATDVKALPSILAQEALLLSASPVKADSILPTWQDRSASFLKDLPDSLPELQGYVETTAKPQANVALAGTNGTPLLASWRYGAGRVIAFASEGAGQWTGDWLKVPAYGKLWAQAVRWSLSTAPRPGLNVEVERQGDRGLVVVHAVTPDGAAGSGVDLVATETNPAGKDQTIKLREAVRGVYQGTFSVDAAGSYRVRVHETAAPGSAAPWQPGSAGLAAAYPERYAPQADGSARLRELAAITGGRVLAGTESLFPGPTKVRLNARPLPQVWLLLGLAVFMAELAMRFMSLGSWWAVLRSVVRRRARSSSEGSAAGESTAP